MQGHPRGCCTASWERAVVQILPMQTLHINTTTYVPLGSLDFKGVIKTSTLYHGYWSMTMLVIEYVVASQNLNSFLLPRAIIPQGLLPSTAQSSSKTYSDFSKVAVLKHFMAKQLLTPRSSNFLTSNLK